MLTSDSPKIVGYYQPETAYQIFTRTILGKDVSTGGVYVDDEGPGYYTHGPSSVFDIKNTPPQQPASECFVLAVPLYVTCTDEQIAALLDGSAEVENNVVVSPAGRPAEALRSSF